MKLRNAFLCLSLLSVFSAHADSVTRDLSNGDWVYQLSNPDNINEQIEWRYTPRNQVDPKIKSDVFWDGKKFIYRYKVSNGKKAKHAMAFLMLRGLFVVDLPAETLFVKTEQTTFLDRLNHAEIQRKAIEEIQNATMTAPPNWYSKWTLKNKKNEDYTKYGWFPNVDDDSYKGVAVGKTVKGFGIARPELPGVMFAETKGATDNRIMKGGLPETGPIADAVKTMQEEDTVWVPVLTPSIAIPQPYNGAELARRIKAHANYWLKLGLITQDTLDRLNRSFDALINAQTYNNIAGTHAAVKEILQEAYSHHRGLDHTKNEEDDDEHDAEPVARKGAAAAPLNRVAARALSFDLTYLLTRAYAWK